jgi:hypothetical protein
LGGFLLHAMAAAAVAGLIVARTLLKKSWIGAVGLAMLAGGCRGAALRAWVSGGTNGGCVVGVLLGYMPSYLEPSYMYYGRKWRAVQHMKMWKVRGGRRWCW